MRTVLFLMASMSFQTLVLAAETDAYVSRYEHIDDALPAISREVQSRVETALKNLNSRAGGQTPQCDWDSLDQELGSQLRRPIYGKIESFVNDNQKLPKFSYDISKSIYRALPPLYYYPIAAATYIYIGFANHIQHDQLLIGADKFGHFFDEGYMYYMLHHKWGFTLERVLELGQMTEATYNGRWGSGIYSYADLIANYEGFQFWKNILGTPESHESSKYIRCEKGVWSLKSSIQLSEYVNAAWDEAMNCDDFRSTPMSESINQAVRELEKAHRKRYECPVFPEKVKTMIDRYREVSKFILNPRFLKLKFSPK